MLINVARILANTIYNSVVFAFSAFPSFCTKSSFRKMLENVIYMVASVSGPG